MGSGYEPGQSVHLVMKTADGVWTNIDGYLDEAPVASNVGTWVAVLNCGEYVRRALVTEGIFAIMATDESYTPLATAPLGFVDTSKPQEEWPKWGQVAIGE